MKTLVFRQREVNDESDSVPTSLVFALPHVQHLNTMALEREGESEGGKGNKISKRGRSKLHKVSKE